MAPASAAPTASAAVTAPAPAPEPAPTSAFPATPPELQVPPNSSLVLKARGKGVQIYDFEFVGFLDGWRGPLENLTTPLGVDQVRGILPRGGTVLKSSRTNPFKIDGGVERIKENLAANGVDALVAIGGEDTLGVATRLADLGVNVVGVYLHAQIADIDAESLVVSGVGRETPGVDPAPERAHEGK